MTPPTRAGCGTASCSVCPHKLRATNGPVRTPAHPVYQCRSGRCILKIFFLFLRFVVFELGVCIYWRWHEGMACAWSSVRPLTRSVVIGRRNPEPIGWSWSAMFLRRYEPLSPIGFPEDIPAILEKKLYLVSAETGE
ncbi:hypothetical protein CGRA01v4_04994 [Colletotrichum graminicola]|nr:hypothetical protein CGRA01v4_04994 [Colletotrichum graminicola]